MGVAEQRPEIPTWVIGAVVGLFVLSLVYGIVVRANIGVVLVLWTWLLGVALSLFVAYLLYRLVLAVEQIAEKL